MVCSVLRKAMWNITQIFSNFACTVLVHFERESIILIQLINQSIESSSCILNCFFGVKSSYIDLPSDFPMLRYPTIVFLDRNWNPHDGFRYHYGRFQWWLPAMWDWILVMPPGEGMAPVIQGCTPCSRHWCPSVRPSARIENTRPSFFPGFMGGDFWTVGWRIPTPFFAKWGEILLEPSDLFGS